MATASGKIDKFRILDAFTCPKAPRFDIVALLITLRFFAAMKTLSQLGTPLSPSATKVMLLGSGELGKEVIISLQRLGV